MHNLPSIVPTKLNIMYTIGKFKFFSEETIIILKDVLHLLVGIRTSGRECLGKRVNGTLIYRAIRYQKKTIIKLNF